MIWFAGAGCFSMDMVTVGVMKVVKEADCILYDHLINKEILCYAKDDCELINVGKIGHGSSFRQDDINELLIKKAMEYQNVVRLKGGDPYLFGRGSEEMRYCLERGYECEYLPGISAAIGGLGYAGIPVTHRGVSSGFSVSTMHYQDGDDHLNYHAIIRNPNTQIFFMGASRVMNLVNKCLEGGMNPDTGIALASSLTYPNEKVLVSTLKDIADIDITPYKSPLLIVLGDTVKFHEELDNTKRLRCFGKRALFLSVDNTRWPIDMLGLNEGIFASERQIADIEYVCHETKDLSRYDELVFVSKNAVRGFIKYLRDNHQDIRKLHDKKLIAIGYKTKEELENHGLTVEATADNSRTAKEYLHDNVLWINGNDARSEYDTLSVYHFVKKDFEIDDEYDAIGVSCPLSIEALNEKGINKDTALFTFGHKSYEKAKELGFRNIHITDSSKESLVNDMVRYLRGENTDEEN